SMDLAWHHPFPVEAVPVVGVVVHPSACPVAVTVLQSAALPSALPPVSSAWSTMHVAAVTSVLLNLVVLVDLLWESVSVVVITTATGEHAHHAQDVENNFHHYIQGESFVIMGVGAVM
ncbi:unnamed protein product, partial [Meganyctiphanes norvegica]